MGRLRHDEDVLGLDVSVQSDAPVVGLSSVKVIKPLGYVQGPSELCAKVGLASIATHVIIGVTEAGKLEDHVALLAVLVSTVDVHERRVGPMLPKP